MLKIAVNSFTEASGAAEASSIVIVMGCLMIHDITLIYAYEKLKKKTLVIDLFLFVFSSSFCW